MAKYKVLWSYKVTTCKSIKNLNIGLKKFENSCHLEDQQKELLLRLFKKIFYLIEHNDCEKIVIFISTSAIDNFRKTVPREITKLIALQIRQDNVDLSLREIDKKILNHLI